MPKDPEVQKFNEATATANIKASLEHIIADGRIAQAAIHAHNDANNYLNSRSGTIMANISASIGHAQMALAELNKSGL